MSLDSIVNVSIVRGTKSVSRAGFGTALVLGTHSVFGEVLRYYESAADVLADGFSTSAQEYKAAQRLFGQEEKPTRIAIGKRSTEATQVTTITPTAVNSAVYTVTINGVEFEFTADGSATASEIVTGLIALINAGTEPVTASGTTTLILTSDSAGLGFSVTVGANLAAVATTPNNGVAEDLAACKAYDNDWYAVCITSREDADILAAAAWVESERKIFIACNDSADALTAATTDIASQLKAKSYARTAYLWSDDHASMPEAAWLGGLLPRDPGSETWKFKTLAGITVDDLSTTQTNFLAGKNGNHYQEVGGVGITAEGTMAEGEFIDVIRFIDWLHAQIQEAVYSRLVSLPKIPYTNAGIGIIEAEVQAQLQRGIRVGGLSNDPAPVVTVPLVADVATLDRADRLLPDVEFTATLAGAIHATEISGVVTV